MRRRAAYTAAGTQVRTWLSGTSPRVSSTGVRGSSTVAPGWASGGRRSAVPQLGRGHQVGRADDALLGVVGRRAGGRARHHPQAMAERPHAADHRRPAVRSGCRRWRVEVGDHEDAPHRLIPVPDANARSHSSALTARQTAPTSRQRPRARSSVSARAVGQRAPRGLSGVEQGSPAILARPCSEPEPLLLGGLIADLVAALEHVRGHTVAHGVAQHRLAVPVPVEDRGRERERELRDGAIEERQAQLDRVGHAVAVGVAQQRGKARAERLGEERAAQRRALRHPRRGRQLRPCRLACRLARDVRRGATQRAGAGDAAAVRVRRDARPPPVPAGCDPRRSRAARAASRSSRAPSRRCPGTRRRARRRPGRRASRSRRPRAPPPSRAIARRCWCSRTAPPDRRRGAPDRRAGRPAPGARRGGARRPRSWRPPRRSATRRERSRRRWR